MAIAIVIALASLFVIYEGMIAPEMQKSYSRANCNMGWACNKDGGTAINCTLPWTVNTSYIATAGVGSTCPTMCEACITDTNFASTSRGIQLLILILAMISIGLYFLGKVE